jgi:hypothetical protein
LGVGHDDFIQADDDQWEWLSWPQIGEERQEEKGRKESSKKAQGFQAKVIGSNERAKIPLSSSQA